MSRRNLATELDEVLCCPMLPNDAKARTVGEYLLRVFRQSWEKGDYFNPKKPLGDADWRTLIYQSLAEEGLVAATVDDEGEYIKLDVNGAHALVYKAIGAMWSPGK